jgi:cation diffusion facilitator family transporter
MKEKVHTAALSIGSNTLLIIMKLIVGIVSGSVSILSEAIHSSLDLVAALIAFFSVKVADTPPDKEHPYGHGKIENISGVIEGFLILVAAGWIIYEAVKRLLGAPTELDNLLLGSIVMGISALVNFFVSRKLYKTAKKTDSIALEADALHLKTDVYTSLGVGLGLFFLWLTNWHWLDPIIAMCVALLIIKESWELMKNAFSPLVDASLTDEETAIIVETLEKHNLHYHNLKTRKSGSYRFADLHLEMPGSYTLQHVHDVCDRIEEEVQRKINNIDLTIHVEPIEDIKP